MNLKSIFAKRSRVLSRILLAAGGLLIVGVLLYLKRPGVVEATPSFLAMAEAHYPAMVGTRIDSCSFCHTSAPALNPYGTAFLNAGLNDAAFNAIANTDSDGDGWTNIQEITALTFPGDPNDHPVAAPTNTPTATLTPFQPPTATATQKPSATATRLPSATATKLSTATATQPPAASPTATHTQAPTFTATQPPAQSPTPTNTMAPSKTPVPGETQTATVHPTRTHHPTRTPGPNMTPTVQCTSESDGGETGDGNQSGIDSQHHRPTPAIYPCEDSGGGSGVGEDGGGSRGGGGEDGGNHGGGGSQTDGSLLTLIGQWLARIFALR